jgi:glucosamine--fructose-6-phosphate aminotransferase (isomerizing)
MEFKTAYCNVNQEYKDNPRLYNISSLNKIKLFLWYGKEFILNPSYLNESLFDNLIGFYSSFIHKDDALHLYNYIKYDKNEINFILKNYYNFFEDKTYGENQWRVGDGQTAFTNFIYYNIGGFSEFDNYLSNEIREGLISRDKALELAKKQNEIRIENIDHFCRIIGINTEEVLLRILNIKPLYQLD